MHSTYYRHAEHTITSVSIKCLQRKKVFNPIFSIVTCTNTQLFTVSLNPALNTLHHPPIRSLIVSEPWLCSLLSVSSAACRLMHSFSRLSLLRSSMQHLSCSSRALASSCCSCLLLSVWVFRSLTAASDSARSNALTSSS